MEPEDEIAEPDVVDVARGLLALADPWMTTEPQLYGAGTPERNP